MELIKKYNLSPDDLRRLYCKNEITAENHERLVDLWGDMLFVEGIHRVLKTQTEKSSAPTYLYQYTFDQISIMKAMINTTISGKNDIFYAI